jgi:hypothetical protein
MTGIIDLREISPGHWRAKYQGNCGVYTIHITFDGEKAVGFSCSCPSSADPCKHIAMVEDAIVEQIAKTQKAKDKKLTNAEDVLKLLNKEELYDFVVRQIRYNSDLTNAVFLDFSHKIETGCQNKYSPILRDALDAVEFNEDGYYDDERSVDLGILDQWFNKACDHLKKNNFQEAVFIAQACIEELALWQYNSKDKFPEWTVYAYQSRPFKILEKAIESRGVDAKKLYDYCTAELSKEKYAETDISDSFNKLLMLLLAEVDGTAYLALQDTLLDAVEDKRSYEAEKILRRKIEFYQKNHNHKEAWKLIEENIQIPAFRKMLAEKKITDKEFVEAKKLIHDYIDDQDSKSKERNPGSWRELLLDIAQKEKDVPAIRRISYSFIDGAFKNYYDIYKSTFTGDEWPEAAEELIKHYDNQNKGFSDSVAKILIAENLPERLMLYIEKHPHIDYLEEYHALFAPVFPEKTLAMFRKIIDEYVKNNIGKSYYERIVKLLKKMEKIENGDKIVNDMVIDYRTRYKTRRVMLDVLKIFPI